MAPVLLSRGLDPLLGVFTGVLAYYLYETNPRTSPPPDQRLLALAQWKSNQWREAKEAKHRALDTQGELVDWNGLLEDTSKKE